MSSWASSAIVLMRVANLAFHFHFCSILESGALLDFPRLFVSGFFVDQIADSSSSFGRIDRDLMIHHQNSASCFDACLLSVDLARSPAPDSSRSTPDDPTQIHS